MSSDYKTCEEIETKMIKYRLFPSQKKVEYRSKREKEVYKKKTNKRLIITREKM